MTYLSQLLQDLWTKTYLGGELKQFLCHCDSRYVGRLLKGCRTASNNTSQNQSETLPHALKHAVNQNAIVNLQPRCHQLDLYHAILPSDYIYYAIPSAYKITMTNNFLFLPKAALLFVYPS